MKIDRSGCFYKLLPLAVYLLMIGGCATASWQPFIAGQMAHQRGDYPTAIKYLEEALKAEPNSTIIQSTLNQVKNALGRDVLKDFDQIPSTDLKNRLAKVKKAAEIVPDSPFVAEKAKEIETSVAGVRSQVAKVIALTDDGHYAEAQSALDEIKKYNLDEVEYCQKLLKNSVEANDRAAKLGVKQPGLFNSYHALSQIQKSDPLGKNAKNLIAEKLAQAKPRLMDGLLAKIEAGKTPDIPKLSFRLAQLYKDALSDNSGDFPLLEAAASRLTIEPLALAIYLKTPGIPMVRIRAALEGVIAAKKTFNLVFLPGKPSTEDLNKLGFILVLGERNEEVVERGRENPVNRTSEYVSSYQTVANPQYQSAQANYQTALARYNQARLQSQSDPAATLGKVIADALFGTPETAAKQKLDEATKLLQSTPEYIEESTKSSYQYQEYDISLQAKFELNYQLIDVKRKVEHQPQKFEWTKEERWQELRNVHPKDVAGLQETKKNPSFRDNFATDFKREADTNLAQALREKILSALGYRFKDAFGIGDMEEALEESVLYAAALYSIKDQSDKEIIDFIAANLLSTQLPTGERDKIDGRSLDLSRTLVQQYGKRALSLEDIEGLLKNFVSSKRVTDLIEERGIRFEATDQAKARLMKAGADRQLIQTLEK